MSDPSGAGRRPSVLSPAPAGAGSTGPGYEALHSSVGLFEDPDRVLLRVVGDRAAGMLNGLVSADLSRLEPEGAVLAFVLSAKGRPIAIPRIATAGGVVYLDVNRAAVDGLLRHFSVYLPPRFANVERMEGVVRASLLGPAWPRAARRFAESLGLPAGWAEGAVAGRVLRPDPDEQAARLVLFAVPRGAEEGPGLDAYVHRTVGGDAVGALARAVAGAGGAVADAADHEVWRIERGLPLYGRDITDANLPQETGLVERAVSFEKGCYTGQEVVARIHYRGHVNRRLRGLEAAHGDVAPLASGAELSAGGRPAGFVTSACRSPRFGPIALAYVRRDVGPGDRVSGGEDDETEWVVRELPFTST